MLTAQEVYTAGDPQDLPGYSDVWTEEDRREFAAHCARQSDRLALAGLEIFPAASANGLPILPLCHPTR